MARRKVEDSNVRKLTKIGAKSLGLTIPIEIVREFGWRERQKVSVKVERRKLIISDWRQ